MSPADFQARVDALADAAHTLALLFLALLGVAILLAGCRAWRGRQ